MEISTDVCMRLLPPRRSTSTPGGTAAGCAAEAAGAAVTAIAAVSRPATRTRWRRERPDAGAEEFKDIGVPFVNARSECERESPEMV
ncbi:hypothetical protein GCM10022377_01850 [Zhihengliuella alba]|uniref:Uncharacterized protein n=1 Tax=Zhihengliuella alba TaxID=547018 RepID=A0ABP7CLP8_9MICC